MSRYYLLEPEVSGYLGDRTIADWNVNPPEVSSVHFVFDGWLGGPLVTSRGVYLVTAEFAGVLKAHGVTGFELAEVEAKTSSQYRELYGRAKLPPLHWMKITGKQGESDMFIPTAAYGLGVTQKVLDLVLATNPEDLVYTAVD